MKSHLFFFIHRRPLSLNRRLLSAAMLFSIGFGILSLVQFIVFGRSVPLSNQTGQRQWFRKVTFFHEQTVAVVQYHLKIPVKCELILAESRDEKEKQKLFESLRHGTDVIKEVSFEEMMSIIHLCNELDKESTPQHVREVEEGGNEMKSESFEESYLASLLSGIVPGTKWCGINDIAVNYHDLGDQQDLDRCCRNHDHCPIKVKAFQSNYGVFNFHPYTKSHCNCDFELYNCLKNVTNSSNLSRLNLKKAQAIGNIYFNIMAIHCIEPRYSAHCLEIKSPHGTVVQLEDSKPQSPSITSISRRSRRALSKLSHPEEHFKKEKCVKWAINTSRKPKYFEVAPMRSF